MKKDQRDLQAQLDTAREAYAEEARERYGHTPQWQESQRRMQVPGAALRAAQEAGEIFSAFAKLAGTPPEAPAAQTLVQRWLDHINRHYYPCGKEILYSLGQSYLTDERFQKNLDAHGPGTAKLMSQAIEVYCKQA